MSSCFKVTRPSPAELIARQKRVEALLTRGVLLLRAGDSSSLRLALNSFRSVAEILPDDPRGYDGLGCVFVRIESYARARRYFETALRLDPSYDPAYAHLAFVDEATGQTDNAAENYRRALLENPLNYRARLNFSLYLKKHHAPLAEMELEKVLLIEAARSP